MLPGINILIQTELGRRRLLGSVCSRKHLQIQ